MRSKSLPKTEARLRIPTSPLLLFNNISYSDQAFLLSHSIRGGYLHKMQAEGEKKDFIPWYLGYVIRFAIKYVNVNNYNNTFKKFLAAEN